MFLEGKSLELLLAAIAALVIVGPKDLPILLRRLGQFMAKLRGMAAEFRASFDEMARQSELDELRREVEALRRGQLADEAARAAGLAETNQVVGEIHQSLADVGVQLHPPMSYQYSEAPSAPGPAEAAPAMTIAAAEPAPKKPRARAKAPAAAKDKPEAAPRAPAKTTAKKAAAGAKPDARTRARKPAGGEG
ncbi:Sec-independent protein translocase protein TatB [Phenylobacterium soli]|uniref:Twin-arginine translocase subunit TatB n=1 Tax=Phenylobacterium soli TaxID=2170551 RepID=A0A328ALB9_9CAUL|nr:Sec-independent protein translocase protein TatB [Phenylobacterium soli]RAK55733.1 twin-arginine translocase subunit TatB [Phenylobacterium soli]